MSKRKCFVICPIGFVNTETRKRADEVFEFIIKPSIEKFGYLINRSDLLSEPGLINKQIIENVLDSELVIADITDHNPNVFYELAIRHFIRKPYIQIIEEGQNIPFDIFNVRTIPINTKDLTSVEEAKKEILLQVENIKDKTVIDSPISSTIIYKDYEKSNNIEKKKFIELLETFTHLAKDVYNIKNLLKEPENVLPIAYLEESISRVQKKYYSPEILIEIGQLVEKLESCLKARKIDKDQIELINIEIMSLINKIKRNSMDYEY
ncbi:MAG: hypothetical protein EHM58_02375 [Ignavibacteriae bacterium]|nr:MAG: hypothetical protein EHM58_02375 [Ignavibacteriota bacterium]